MLLWFDQLNQGLESSRPTSSGHNLMAQGSALREHLIGQIMVFQKATTSPAEPLHDLAAATFSDLIPYPPSPFICLLSCLSFPYYQYNVSWRAGMFSVSFTPVSPVLRAGTEPTDAQLPLAIIWWLDERGQRPLRSSAVGGKSQMCKIIIFTLKKLQVTSLKVLTPNFIIWKDPITQLQNVGQYFPSNSMEKARISFLIQSSLSSKLFHCLQLMIIMLSKMMPLQQVTETLQWSTAQKSEN